MPAAHKKRPRRMSCRGEPCNSRHGLRRALVLENRRHPWVHPWGYPRVPYLALVSSHLSHLLLLAHRMSRSTLPGGFSHPACEQSRIPISPLQMKRAVPVKYFLRRPIFHCLDSRRPDNRRVMRGRSWRKRELGYLDSWGVWGYVLGFRFADYWRCGDAGCD